MRGQLAVQSSFHHCKQNKYVIETGFLPSISPRDPAPRDYVLRLQAQPF